MGYLKNYDAAFDVASPRGAPLFISHLCVTRLPRDMLANTPKCRDKKLGHHRNGNSKYMWVLYSRRDAAPHKKVMLNNQNPCNPRAWHVKKCVFQLHITTYQISPRWASILLALCLQGNEKVYGAPYLMRLCVLHCCIYSIEEIKSAWDWDKMWRARTCWTMWME